LFWFVLAHLVTFLVDLLIGTRHADRDKDLQIVYGSGTSAPRPGFP